MKETTMDTQTNQPQNLKQYIKWLKKAVDQGHLYDAEEYAKKYTTGGMMDQMRANIEELAKRI